MESLKCACALPLVLAAAWASASGAVKLAVADGPSGAGRGRGAAVDDIPQNVGWDELFWYWVSDMRCQFGGDNLGVAVEEQNGQRPGNAH